MFREQISRITHETCLANQVFCLKEAMLTPKRAGVPFPNIGSRYSTPTNALSIRSTYNNSSVHIAASSDPLPFVDDLVDDGPRSVMLGLAGRHFLKAMRCLQTHWVT